MKRIGNNDDIHERAPLELLQPDLLRTLVERYCCDTKEPTQSFATLQTLRALSQTMKRRMHGCFKRPKCGRCHALIQPRVQFYVLGGGRVPTCTPCACDATFTVTVNRVPVTFKRAWNVPADGAEWLKLQRTEDLYTLCLYKAQKCS